MGYSSELSFFVDGWFWKQLFSIWTKLAYVWWGNVYEHRTLLAFCDVTFAGKYKITFYWLTPFVDSFVNSDRPQLVAFFHTNEQDDEQNASWSTFQTKVIYDEVLRQICATCGIEIFRKEHQKAIDMFFEGKEVSISLPTGYGKSFI